MATRKKLNLPQVEKLIEDFQVRNPQPSAAALLAFAEQIKAPAFASQNRQKLSDCPWQKQKLQF